MIDEQIQAAIEELDREMERDRQKLFEETVKVDDLYPEPEILEIAIKCAEEQRINNNVHINKLRTRYNGIKNFQERRDYYHNTLQVRELGFRLVQEKLNKFINNPKVNPHSVWVKQGTLAEINKNGIKAVVTDELLFGNLIKK